VLSLVLRCEYPRFVRKLPQPAKGLALLAVTFVTAAVVSTLTFYLAGRITPPPPMVLVYVIFSVVVTFWFAVIWGSWPVSARTQNPTLIALSILSVTYLIGYLIFHWLFNFKFLVGTP